MRARRAKWSGSHWKSVQLAAWNRAKGKGTIPACEVCGKPAERGEVAHLHPLGRGRSRHDSGATCSNCNTLLNHPDNVRWVCSSLISNCHARLDREQRPECRRQDHGEMD